MCGEGGAHDQLSERPATKARAGKGGPACSAGLTIDRSYVQKPITSDLETFQAKQVSIGLVLDLNLLPPGRVTALTLTHHIRQAAYAVVLAWLVKGCWLGGA